MRYWKCREISTEKTLGLRRVVWLRRVEPMPEILLDVCCSRNFCPTATGTSSTCIVRRVFRNLQCFWISQPVTYRVGTHDIDPGHNSPNVDARLELIHTFAASTKVYLCADVTVLDTEHTPKQKAHSLCLQALLYKKFARWVLMSPFETLQP